MGFAGFYLWKFAESRRSHTDLMRHATLFALPGTAVLPIA
jgi:hypothetical protein